MNSATKAQRFLSPIEGWQKQIENYPAYTQDKRSD